MIFTWLLLLVPFSLSLAYLFDAAPLWIFAGAVLAIVPLAEWIRRATEQLARISGPQIGGLLNVSFGNSAELVLALFVLAAGHPDVVKAQITGSLIGNSLLGLGIAILVGSRGRDRQTFAQAPAGLLSSLLILSLIGLLVPAFFDATERGTLDASGAATLAEKLSLGVSAVLVLVYLGNLAYTLLTHRDVFARPAEGEGEREGEAGSAAGGATAKPAGESSQENATNEGANASFPRGEWSLARSLLVLFGATAVTALEAELVSGALTDTATSLGVTPFFLGITVLAVIGNAAEYISAAWFASRDRMGMVLSITVGSSIQVALLVAPLLVLGSWLMGTPMDLVFRPLEVLAVACVAFSVNAVTRDGETTWFEGVLLVAVYAILAFAFFLLTP